MKKIMSLAAALVLLTTTAMAQASFGIGYMNPTHPMTNDALNGAYVGLDYNITLSGNFGIAPGVYYSYSGKSTSNNVSVFGITASGKTTYAEQYVSVPLNFNYGLDLAKDMTIRLYAGPTFSYGLSSTVKADGSIAGLSGSTGKQDLYTDNGNYSNFDILIGGGVAFDYAQQFRISLGYNYGVKDRNASDNVAYKRSYLHMGIAYLF